ncbi:OB-fold domain-containing protein [Frankia sp. AgB1.9]|uniref:Zn-ribbon domain-containing OB-fold protein n=1 Tax=unclassified Frankia TaxID=2632575 RepID=UPI001932BB0F|nr:MULTISPECIES: OB-fold domain-containing protein [unclassified Frankia]MBL7487566.1 OB-fold domain-containing protein [Frankia sp. AgW1.1]MBL7549538.1 OB-fold domain-containing protein [Frankia sp. AgB1.9]MBL7620673.1 OB-fold domain-containing protein [Frankia sp. AgB1.8]
MTRFVESTITFPYKRSLGPVTGAFMTALAEKRILGVRSGAAVLVPPMEWDPATGAELTADLVEVGPAGTVESWTWVPAPTEQHPLDRPFAFAFIRLDGASVPLLHAVDAGSAAAVSEGMRVAPRWRGQRIGHITDIQCFVLGENAEVDGPDAGSPAQPVELMDYTAAVTYSTPVPVMADRAVAATREQRLIGLRCPACARVYVGGDRPYCPVDALELGPDSEVDLPSTGTITNFIVVEPVRYPGQTETEPFARVFVLLDDTEVVLTYQPVIDLPVGDIHVGVRVAAVWAPKAAPVDTFSGIGRPMGSLLGWTPSGEPDVNDPDLVNRIY